MFPSSGEVGSSGVVLITFLDEGLAMGWRRAGRVLGLFLYFRSFRNSLEAGHEWKCIVKRMGSVMEQSGWNRVGGD